MQENTLKRQSGKNKGLRRNWLIGLDGKEDPFLTGAMCSMGIVTEKVRELDNRVL